MVVGTLVDGRNLKVRCASLVFHWLEQGLEKVDTGREVRVVLHVGHDGTLDGIEIICSYPPLKGDELWIAHLYQHNHSPLALRVWHVDRHAL